jgi:HEAT repeat protein
MKWRSLLALAVILVVVVIGVALALPASPFYLAKWFDRSREYEGHQAPHWIKLLDSPEKEERREAARALARIGYTAKESIPALCKTMTDDTDLGTRVEASFALSKMDPKSTDLAQAVPALAKALEDPDAAVRMNAAQTLMKLGAAARPAAPALLRAVEDKANDTNRGMHIFTVQDMAALALGKATAGTAEAVPALRKLLAAADLPSSRQPRVRALGFVGPEARPALPELRAMFIDPAALVASVGAVAGSRSWMRDQHLRLALEEAIRSIEGGAPPGP